MKASANFFEIFGNPLLIAEISDEGKYLITEINTAFQINLGYAENEIIGKELETLLLWKNAEPLKNAISKFNNGKIIFLKDIIIETILKNEKVIKAGIVLTAERNEKNIPFRLMIMISDITLRVDYQKQIHQKNAELSQNYKLIKNMTNTITHKFSNYLTPVSTYSNLWIDRIESGNINKNDLLKTFDSIRKILTELTQFIDSTFKLAQFDMKIFEVDALDVFSIIEKSKDFLQELLNRKNLKIVNKVPENIVVYGNNFLIKEVIENLLVNACKYSFENTEIICCAKKYKNSGVCFYFANKSESISRRFRKLIFKPYFRAVENQEKSGEGLGLAICNAVIKRHNGKIGVIPKDNNTNIFYFTLPSSEWTPALEIEEEEE